MMIDFDDLTGAQPEHERQAPVEETPVQQPSAPGALPAAPRRLELRSRREYAIGPGRPRALRGTPTVSFGDEGR